MRDVARRPYPLPSRPWIMHQRWNDFLTMHWPVPVAALREVVPPELTLQAFDGTGWLGVVPFHMSNVRPRCVPPIPFFSRFPELNVRTYVTHGGLPGVHFLSLDAHNRLAVEMARLWYRLPYFQARMAWRREGDVVHYESRRTDRRGRAAELVGSYAWSGEARAAEPGTLEHFLIERYCLFTVDGRGRVRRTDVHHAPWPVVRRVEADFPVNTMAAAHGIALPDTAPHLMYADHVEVRIWHPVTASGRAASRRGR